MLSPVDESSPPLAVIFGTAGETLSESEADFFRAANPLGFILFGRNCRDPDQLRALVQSLKDCVGRDAPVLIDQEGGRVRRLRPPHWADVPAAKELGDLYAQDAARGRHALIAAMEGMAKELAGLGIQVDCAPVLDILYPETHEAIGTRAYSDRADTVATLGGLVCDTFLNNGIVPVLKHLPGQGRAASDSHYDLPVVRASLDDMRATDFAPFRAIAARPDAGRIWGMVSHIVYEDVDKEFPASCSPAVIGDIVRKDVGFQGLVLSDDTGMGALSKFGDAGERLALVVRAGCDIGLHCNGKMDEMTLAAARVEKMTKQAVTRYNRSILNLSV